LAGTDDPAGQLAPRAEGFSRKPPHQRAGTSRALSVTVRYPRRERTQTVENRSSCKPHISTDPVSLGELCQAMFLEGARVLGFTGEAAMPREVQEQVFLAATLVADGLGLLLEAENDEDDDEQDLAG
jgi:hypothetical protein